MHLAERDAAGFRRRGHEVTRLMAFVDAAFAFAVTLLVISLNGIPATVSELVLALKGIPAFAASFALLTQIWWIHTRYTWRFGLEDAASVRLSLLLVFLVLVYVYPLKILFGNFFAWISNGWLPSQFQLHTVDDLRAMFMVYGAAWALLGLVVAALYRHAWRCAESLELDAEERVQVRLQIAGYLYMPILGLLSIAAAWALPDRPARWQVAAPGLIYFLMFLQAPLLARVARHFRGGG